MAEEVIVEVLRKEVPGAAGRAMEEEVIQAAQEVAHLPAEVLRLTAEAIQGNEAILRPVEAEVAHRVADAAVRMEGEILPAVEDR